MSLDERIRSIAAALPMTPRGREGRRAVLTAQEIVRRAARKAMRRLSAGDGCWLWTGRRDRGGYGRHSVGYVQQAAHRRGITGSALPKSPAGWSR